MEVLNDIYILKKKKLMYGPYTLAAVKEKGLKHEDMVWFTGLPDWTPVAQVESLVQFVQSKTSKNLKKKTLIEKMFGFLN